VLIQILLIAATLGLVALLLRRRGTARTRAWKRLIMVSLAVAAVVSILYPDLTTRVANFLGVGRGTDLLLYVLVAVFFYVVVGFYLKFRDVERQVTVLARRLAIDEATQRQQGIWVPVAPQVSTDD
jgi:hypothetical protein